MLGLSVRLLRTCGGMGSSSSMDKYNHVLLHSKITSIMTKIIVIIRHCY